MVKFRLRGRALRLVYYEIKVSYRVSLVLEGFFFFRKLGVKGGSIYLLNSSFYGFVCL